MLDQPYTRSRDASTWGVHLAGPRLAGVGTEAHIEVVDIRIVPKSRATSTPDASPAARGAAHSQESPMPVTKDTLLRKADALLGEARRVRKLSAGLDVEGDRLKLIRHAEDLEGQAARLEKDAVAAKNGVFVTRPD